MFLSKDRYIIFGYSRHILSRFFLAQEHSMSEPISYLNGLQRLIVHLKSCNNDHDYKAALIFQQRLTDNLDQATLHGDTELLRHDRSTIINHLNDITERTHSISFLEYCRPTGQSPRTTGSFKPGFLLSANNYIIPLHKAIQEGIAFLSQDGALWPDECKRLRNKFQRFHNYDIPFDNSALMQLRIKLLHLDQQTDYIINSLDTFCPECNRSGNKLIRQRQETCEKLQLLLYEVEHAIASLNALNQLQE
jgi:hypothetical protein